MSELHLKKNLVLLVICLFSFPAFAQQKSFFLSGSLTGVSATTKVYLEYTNRNQNILDSCITVNGSFNFRGAVPEPTEAYLCFHSFPATYSKDFLSFYVEPGAVLKLSAKFDLTNVVLSGSTINEDDQKLKSLVQPLVEEAAAYRVAYYKLGDNAAIDSLLANELNRKYRNTLDEIDSVSLKFAVEHPKSYISLIAILQLIERNKHIKEIENLYNNLSFTLKSTKLGQQVSATFERLKANKIHSVSQ